MYPGGYITNIELSIALSNPQKESFIAFNVLDFFYKTQ